MGILKSPNCQLKKRPSQRSSEAGEEEGNEEEKRAVGRGDDHW